MNLKTNVKRNQAPFRNLNLSKVTLVFNFCILNSILYILLIEINEKLNTEINLRDNRIKEMKEVMSSNKFDFEVQMQNQISQHLREIETINKENEQKRKNTNNIILFNLFNFFNYNFSKTASR